MTNDPVPTSNLGSRDPRLWPLDYAPQCIYVAASVNNQLPALRLALRLQWEGFRVTSQWLLSDFSARPRPNEDWSKWVQVVTEWGAKDLEDLAGADTLVLLADVPSSSGGFHVELGFFLGSGRTNIVVVGGDRPNVFFWTKTVRWVPDAEGLVEWLAGQRGGAAKFDEADPSAWVDGMARAEEAGTKFYCPQAVPDTALSAEAADHFASTDAQDVEF